MWSVHPARVPSMLTMVQVTESGPQLPQHWRLFIKHALMAAAGPEITRHGDRQGETGRERETRCKAQQMVRKMNTSKRQRNGQKAENYD